MNSETRYRYEKRIRELESKVNRLESDVHQFRSACSEIYDGMVEVLGKDGKSLNPAWILQILKRAWRPAW